MTIKLCLLKSGEDIITDLTEMRTEEGPQGRVIGYFFEKPCVVKMRNPQQHSSDGNTKKAGFEVSLFPWMPLTLETRIQKARTSRNPKTNEKIEVPEKKTIHFKMSKKWFKDLNNE